MSNLSLIGMAQLMEVIRLARTTPVEGIIVEVGVYKGGSAIELLKVAKERGQELWLFDTFSGMPESTAGLDHHRIGEFSDCSVEAVRALVPEARIFKGFFPDTWNSEVTELPKISFAHIDCDQYVSISNCIKIFKPLMLKGGIMWFDDYGQPWLPGATKAVEEQLPERIVHPMGRAYYIF
jgi:O-methyltransferase